jgi:hypothetical protein
VESQEKTYFSWLKTKESVATTVRGKMGFHINLADSVHTRFTRTDSVITITAPLQLTYLSLDLATLQQVKEASIDPSIRVDPNEVIKHLSQKALQKYLPPIMAQLKNHPLNSQEQQLGKLVGRRVKIVLSSMPTANSDVEN